MGVDTVGLLLPALITKLEQVEQLVRWFVGWNTSLARWSAMCEFRIGVARKHAIMCSDDMSSIWGLQALLWRFYGRAAGCQGAGRRSEYCAPTGMPPVGAGQHHMSYGECFSGCCESHCTVDPLGCKCLGCLAGGITPSVVSFLAYRQPELSTTGGCVI